MTAIGVESGRFVSGDKSGRRQLLNISPTQSNAIRIEKTSDKAIKQFAVDLRTVPAIVLFRYEYARKASSKLKAAPAKLRTAKEASSGWSKIAGIKLARAYIKPANVKPIVQLRKERSGSPSSDSI